MQSFDSLLRIQLGRTIRPPSRLRTGPHGAVRAIQTTPLRLASPPPPPPKTKTEAPRDEGIRAPLIRLVDPSSGKVTGPFKPRDIVQKLDRKTYSLVQVAQGAGGTEKKAEWALEELPICKLVSKREEYQKQREQKRRATTSGAPATSKDMQLTWNVSTNDLAHKVARAQKELRKCHKVRVVILSKKGTKRVLPGSAEEDVRIRLVDSIKHALTMSTEDPNAVVARVVQEPIWKNQRSMLEMHIEPVG